LSPSDLLADRAAWLPGSPAKLVIAIYAEVVWLSPSDLLALRAALLDRLSLVDHSVLRCVMVVTVFKWVKIRVS
jgi:hypothetical protein